ncbi:glycosyltransferase [Hyphobacterium sp.]|uniref:glycosyltransferase n=1 Tax=Hyphobacterium sp. TaxID=2004662 RepID=UPI003BA9352D
MKILVLSRHFPPAVSGGARRPYLWAKGLMEAGNEVFVIAPDMLEGVDGKAVPHPFRDPPTGVPGPKTLRDHARDLLLWPDPDIRWTRRALAVAKAECPFQPDWILTTSPPESIHAAGKALKAHWQGAKWAIDARDHWLIRPFREQRQSVTRKTIEASLAKRMLASADAVFAVNDPIRDEFRDYAPNAEFHTLAHFVRRPAEPFEFEGPGPHLVHTGSFNLSDPYVSIDPLLRAFEQALDRSPSLQLHLAGRLRDDESQAVQNSTACDSIQLHGIVPLDTALSLQAGADALIVVAAPNSPVPPGKLQEYRATGRPVIPVGEGEWRKLVDDLPGSDAEQLAAVKPFSGSACPEGVVFYDDAMKQVSDTLRRL